MKDFLKRNLPKGYKKSTMAPGGYSMEVASVVRMISVRASDFTLDGSHGWVFYLMLSVNDVFDIDGGSCLHVFDASIDKNTKEVGCVVNAYDRLHYGNDDIDVMANDLKEKIIPWFEWIGEPRETIAYLIDLEVFENEDAHHRGIDRYGSLISVNGAKMIRRSRKYFNGAIASIYLSLGEFERALFHLKRHREFLVGDNKEDLLNGVLLRRLGKLDEAIRDLKGMC